MADRADQSRNKLAACLSGHHCLIFFLLLLTCRNPSLVAAAADESLITIQSKIWGFDGRVQTGQFNPVSFLIDNRTEDSIEAVAALSHNAIMGTNSGRFEQSVFIGPGAQRWIQLYPYIANDDQSEWTFTLGDLEFRGQQQPRSANALVNLRTKQKPLSAAIILDAPGTMSLQPVTVKHFPESIFPPWSTATVGLHTIFMDHEPDWEEPRQKTLMSWLRRGGRLHLLKNSRNEWPTFRGQLADLSQPLDSFSVDSGLVTRHDFGRADLTKSVVRAALDTGRDSDPEELPEDVQAAGDLLSNSSGFGSLSDYHNPELSWLDGHWFDAMRQFTQPSHAWWLIILLSLVYIGLIFPGCWLLARSSQRNGARRMLPGTRGHSAAQGPHAGSSKSTPQNMSRQHRHFLIVYGAIAGLSVVFSVLFLFIGRRGYGERTTLHTIAVSRIEGSTTQNVMEWNALFVTTGGQYTITGTGEQALFAIPQLQQQTNAVMTGGNSGQLSVGIPPFSTQPFICRRQLPVADWQLKVTGFQQAEKGKIANLQIQCGPAFKIDEGAKLRLQYGRNLYHVSFDESTRLLKQTRPGGSLARFCNQYSQHRGSFGWEYHGTDMAEHFYDGLLPGAILRSFAEDGIYDPLELDLPADRIRLFVYTVLPSDHFVTTNTNARKQGRIMYVRDIPLDGQARLSGSGRSTQTEPESSADSAHAIDTEFGVRRRRPAHSRADQ